MAIGTMTITADSPIKKAGSKGSIWTGRLVLSANSAFAISHILNNTGLRVLNDITVNAGNEDVGGMFRFVRSLTAAAGVLQYSSGADGQRALPADTSCTFTAFGF